METPTEGSVSATNPPEMFHNAFDNRNFLPDELNVIKEGIVSAIQHKDLLQVRLLKQACIEKQTTIPPELDQIESSLEKEWADGRINIKMDTRFEDETANLPEGLTLRKIARLTKQNVDLESGTSTLLAVVIPSYWGEKDHLATTLQSVHDQKFDGPIITVVSDNNDETGKAKYDVGSYALSAGANVAKGSITANIASARRKGVDRALISESSAQPMIIISTDSDSKLDVSFLKAVHTAYQDQNIIATCGPLQFDSSEPEVTKLQTEINNSIRNKTQRGLPHMPGANSTVRSDIYRQIGGYCLDYTMGEDGNLAQKIRDYLKYEGNLKDQRVLFNEAQIVGTSSRKYVDTMGKYSLYRRQRYDHDAFKNFFTNVSHPEGLMEALLRPRDSESSRFYSYLRQIKDYFRYHMLFFGDGEEKIREGIKISRRWDNFYQRANNTPKIRAFVLDDTSQTRGEIDKVFDREKTELGNLESSSLDCLVVKIQQVDKAVSVYLIRNASSAGTGNRYVAIEVENQSGKDPFIASMVTIDEGAQAHCTKVSWLPESAYFHPSDDYPRTATLIFNTHTRTAMNTPTENVDIRSSKELKQDELLRTALLNSITQDSALSFLESYLA